MKAAAPHPVVPAALLIRLLGALFLTISPPAP